MTRNNLLAVTVIFISAYGSCIAQTKIKPTPKYAPQTVIKIQPESLEIKPLKIEPVQIESLNNQKPSNWWDQWITPFATISGVLITALFLQRRGTLDARYSYTAEIYKLRLRQVEEFYCPALLLIEQSKILYDKLLWTLENEGLGASLGIDTEGFRLLDHIYVLNNEQKTKPIINEIMITGKALTSLITDKAGLIEGGMSQNFIAYTAHYAILKSARKQNLETTELQGWHKFGYYPRLLNRDIKEGYKEVSRHLKRYSSAGDKTINELLKGPRNITIRSKQHKITHEEYARRLMRNLHFYEDNAKEYSQQFDKFDMSVAYKQFENSFTLKSKDKIPRILDLGCGTGRDAAYFLKKGYAVTAIDASPAMLRKCKSRLKRMSKETDVIKSAFDMTHFIEATFDEFESDNQFNGIWASASLLHEPKDRIQEIFLRLVGYLDTNGILYMSFKYGEGERERDSRFYTYFSNKEIRRLLKASSDTEIVNIWLSDVSGQAVEVNKEAEMWKQESNAQFDSSLWLNVLIKKK